MKPVRGSRARRRSRAAPRRLAGLTHALPVLVASAALSVVSCINASVPLAPECTAAIRIDVSSDTVKVGDTFVVTAAHRGDECLSNLMWTVDGPITLRAAEGHSATIRADESGTGTVRVQNDKGSLGVLDVEIQEGEEESGAASARVRSATMVHPAPTP